MQSRLRIMSGQPGQTRSRDNRERLNSFHKESNFFRCGNPHVAIIKKHPPLKKRAWTGKRPASPPTRPGRHPLPARPLHRSRTHAPDRGSGGTRSRPHSRPAMPRSCRPAPEGIANPFLPPASVLVLLNTSSRRVSVSGNCESFPATHLPLTYHCSQSRASLSDHTHYLGT